MLLKTHLQCSGALVAEAHETWEGGKPPELDFLETEIQSTKDLKILSNVVGKSANRPDGPRQLILCNDFPFIQCSFLAALVRFAMIIILTMSHALVRMEYTDTEAHRYSCLRA